MDASVEIFNLIALNQFGSYAFFIGLIVCIFVVAILIILKD